MAYRAHCCQIIPPSFLFSIYNGLLLALTHRTFTDPHVYRDSVSSVERIARFVITVNWYLLLWVKGDLFSTDSKAYQSIRNIRSIHTHISRKMNERDRKEEGKDVLWINQLGQSVCLSHCASLETPLVTLY